MRRTRTVLSGSVVPDAPVTVTEARNVTVGMWVVPRGHVEDIYESGVSEVRRFVCKHPHQAKRTTLVTYRDTDLVLVRHPIPRQRRPVD